MGNICSVCLPSEKEQEGTPFSVDFERFRRNEKKQGRKLREEDMEWWWESDQKSSRDNVT